MHNPSGYPSEAAAKQAFGARLRVALEALDIRPSVAASMLGVSQPRFTHWLKGRHWPDCHRLGLFCHLTGVTTDYLILGKMGALPGDIRDTLRKASERISENTPTA